MPSATVNQSYKDRMLSFLPGYDLDAEAMNDRDTVTMVNPEFKGVEPSKLLLSPAHHQLPPTHKHNHSTSTRHSESLESSPTTTFTDSTSVSDPSPSSSPDSPTITMPHSAFGPTGFAGLSSMVTLSVSDVMTAERPKTSPAHRRPKNMKSLSIQTPLNPYRSLLNSEPASPAFIKPKMTTMKRKPSHLSLKTSSTDLAVRSHAQVAPSPGLPPIHQRRALKHASSSPQMVPPLKSSMSGLRGGMVISTVLERNESGLSEVLRPSKPAASTRACNGAIDKEVSPIRTQIARRTIFDSGASHDSESNEDYKTPTYPDGPIAIYGNNVFLYSEPSAEQASQFDVVINVAWEVPNPFKQLLSPHSAADDSLIMETAASSASFATALESFEPGQPLESPCMPKASATLRAPEYIHIPWDHATDIGPDLMGLCQIIERKTKQGKKVLVHCQQGASRSASLIIAYGLYLNPDLSVNDAYYTAQTKSRWISPNMKLMYCLQDFRKEVSKHKMASCSAFHGSRSPSKHRTALSVDATSMSHREPQTAPLPTTVSQASGESGQHCSTRPRGLSTPLRSLPISLGPSSAPSYFSWANKDAITSCSESTPKPSERHASRLTLNERSTTSVSQPPNLPTDLVTKSKTELVVHRVPSLLKLQPASTQRPKSSRTRSAALDVSQAPPMSLGFAPSRFGSLGNATGSLSFGAGQPGLSSSRFGFSPMDAMVFPEKPEVASETVAERHLSVALLSNYPDYSALQSPRAEQMTKNPLRDGPSMLTRHCTDEPRLPMESLFSPRDSTFPRDSLYPFTLPNQSADPRSPPTRGEMPIVRSIDEVL